MLAQLGMAIVIVGFDIINYTLNDSPTFSLDEFLGGLNASRHDDYISCSNTC